VAQLNRAWKEVAVIQYFSLPALLACRLGARCGGQLLFRVVKTCPFCVFRRAVASRGWSLLANGETFQSRLLSQRDGYVA
jgi:hypothetical protein